MMFLMSVCLVEAALLAQSPTAAARFPTTPRASVPLESAPSGVPAVAAGRVYLSFDSGHLAAYRVSDAREVWRIDLPVDQVLAATGEVVLAASGGAVYALRARDGTVAWRADTGALSAPPLAHEGWVIVPSTRQLIALRADDGSTVWARDSSPVAARATIEGDRLYVPLADGRVQAFDLRTGNDVWSRRLGGSPTSVLALPDRLYVGAADGYFYCLDAGRGTIRWRFRMGAAARGAPASDGSLVYTVSLDNLVRAYDRGHGARTWQAGIPYRALAGPVVVGGALVVAGPAATLSVFDAVSGRSQPPVVFDAPLVTPVGLGRDGQHVVLAVAVGSLEHGWRLVLLDSSYAVPLVPLTAIPGEPVPLWMPGK